MIFVSYTDLLRQYSHILARKLPFRHSFRLFFLDNEFVSTVEFNMLYVVEKLYGHWFWVSRFRHVSYLIHVLGFNAWKQKKTNCLCATLPRFLLQRRSFSTAWFGWFYSRALLTEPRLSGRFPANSFLCLRGLYRMVWRRLKVLGNVRSFF